MCVCVCVLSEVVYAHKKEKVTQVQKVGCWGGALSHGCHGHKAYGFSAVEPLFRYSGNSPEH